MRKKGSKGSNTSRLLRHTYEHTNTNLEIQIFRNFLTLIFWEIKTFSKRKCVVLRVSRKWKNRKDKKQKFIILLHRLPNALMSSLPFCMIWVDFFEALDRDSEKRFPRYCSSMMNNRPKIPRLHNRKNRIVRVSSCNPSRIHDECSLLYHFLDR